MGDPTAVSVGPGLLFVAPTGTAEPTSAEEALAAAFREVGYTAQGSRVGSTRTIEQSFVEEEVEPVITAVTRKVTTVRFEMAEFTLANLALALDGIADFTGDEYESVDPGDEERVMLVLDKEDGKRFLFRQCFPGGEVGWDNKKAPTMSVVPVEFSVEKPAGAKAWTAWNPTGS